MKHVVCGGVIEIRTDPKNTAYVVTEGGKKRDTGEDKELEGDFVIKTEEERERLRNDAFAALEGKVADKKQAETDHSRIRELAALRERDWADPYVGSQRLRKTFRVERRERERKEDDTEALKEKMGLGIELVDETEGDRRRAELVDFGDLDGDAAIVKARAKSLFSVDVDGPSVESKERSKARRKKSKRQESLEIAAARKAQLQREVQGNTLAAIDPFLVDNEQWRSAHGNGRVTIGIKRKQARQEQPSPEEDGHQSDKDVSIDLVVDGSSSPKILPPSLVDYDSDS